MLRMSGLKSREAAVAVGRSILIDCSLIIVRLAIMNEAIRKNMMSISGIISMRAFLCGNGEPIFMLDELKGILGVQHAFIRSFRCSPDCILAFPIRAAGRHLPSL